MLIPLDHHQILVLLVQVAVLLAAARGLGFVSRRLGQPAVVGELAAGVLLGPSVLGELAPALAGWLFPADEVQSGLILALAWLGVVLLLTVTGLEIDLPLVRRLARASALVPIGAVVVPVGFGFGLGLLVPAVFVGAGADRTLFAAFLGVALAMSALPVVARILTDMGLIRRDVGQLTMVAAMADDLLGWLLLGVLTGVATHGGFDLGEIAVTLAAVAVFVVLAFTVGQRLVDAVLRATSTRTEGIAGSFTAAVLIALVAAALTQWIGTEAVLGAFVAGIVLGRSPVRRREVQHGLELMTTAVFAPLFFATAGMYLDLRALASLEAALWTVALLVVASASKLGGAWLGARLNRADAATGLAVGVGLNARGALGIITAAVALRLEVFSDAAYTAVVLMALVTSMMVPPLLRWALARVSTSPDEAERLQRETLLGQSVTVNARRVLLPTRGGAHSRVAATIVDLVMPPSTTVTVLGLHTGDASAATAAVRSAGDLLRRRPVTYRVRQDSAPADGILREAEYGYDLLAVGASEQVRTSRQFSPVLARLLTQSSVPVLLVRSDAGEDGAPSMRRVLTTATGTRTGRAAEEVAFLLGAQSGADVDVVHVVGRSDRILHAVWVGNLEGHPAARSILESSLELARRFGMAASGVTRVGASAWDEVLAAAIERGADTIVVSTFVRDVDGQPFLGHGVEYLLENAPQRLVVVAFPPGVPAP